jgi:hypothetical protein
MQLYGMLKPPAMASVGGPVPRRVQMELPGPAGNAARRNMPAGWPSTDAAGAPAQLLPQE